ncbi:MAG: osmotically inducible protein C [Acidobacteria bacterium]|nr:MAG: osmotically inducible protein C [Acidobacteriota bacterium]
MITKEKTMNGVNVEQLFGTIDAIQSKPELARFQFRAENRWIDGAHNRSFIKSFYGAGREDDTRTRSFQLDSDEPAVLLGHDQAASAGEYVLHALAACLTGTLVYHAAALGIRIEKIESKLEGDVDLRGFLGLSDEVRNGYENIRVTFRIKADAPQEKIEELLDLAKKRSPVFDIISNPVPVSVQLEKK